MRRDDLPPLAGNATAPSNWREHRHAAFWRRIVPRTILTVAVIASTLVAGMMAASAMSDNKMHDLTVALRDRGVTVDDAEVEVRDRRSGRSTVTDARVTFDAGGRGSITTPLLGAMPDYADTGTWVAATTKTGYDGPITVEYLPSDPTRVMANKDIDYYSDASMARAEAIISAAALLAPLSALTVWLVRGRPRWWLYFDKIGEPCWYCAHPRENHDSSGRCTVNTRDGACSCTSYEWHRPARTVLASAG